MEQKGNKQTAPKKTLIPPGIPPPIYGIVPPGATIPFASVRPPGPYISRMSMIDPSAVRTISHHETFAPPKVVGANRPSTQSGVYGPQLLEGQLGEIRKLRKKAYEFQEILSKVILAKLKGDTKKQAEAYQVLHTRLRDFKKSVIYENRIKESKKLNIEDCRVIRLDKELPELPKLPESDAIPGTYKVKLYKGGKGNFHTLLSMDFEALNRGGYQLQTDKNNDTFRISRPGLFGELVVQELEAEGAVAIKDGTRNSQKLRQLIELEQEKDEEDLSLLTIVKLWKKADKIS